MTPSSRAGVLLLVGMIVLGFIPLPTGAVRLSDFFAFGPDFDEALETGNDPSVAVDLTQPIPYFGQIRNRIIVSIRHSSDNVVYLDHWM